MTTRPYNSPSLATPAQLFGAWTEAQDEAAHDELIQRYLPLARKLAGRYIRSGEPYEDLVQVASLGLVKAVDRFDPAQGVEFPAYAVPTIVGELKRHFRDRTWTVKVDRRAQELARAVVTAERMLTAIGRAPTVTDLAAALHCDEEDVLEGLQAAMAYSPISLDAPTTTPDGESDTIGSMFDAIGAVDARLDQADTRTTLRSAVRRLPKLERRILFFHYGEELSQREIADRVGVSQMHVSRLLRRALDSLREQLTTTDPKRVRS